MQIFFTIVSGVGVFVISQLFIEYFLKPIQDYKKLRSKIAYELTLYANLYMNPTTIDKMMIGVKDAEDDLRKLAAEVDAEIELRPKFNYYIPKKEILSEVSSNLIGLSNSFCGPNPDSLMRHNSICRKNIRNLLELTSRK